MKISLNWLGQYVDLSGLDIDKIAGELTMKTAEVEEVHALNPALPGMVLALLKEVTPVEEGLNLVSLNLGALGEAQVLSRAGNLRPGMLSVFAKAGSTIADGRDIEPLNIKGQVSQGMLLSPLELGISQYQDGVMDLPVGVSGAGVSLKAGSELSALMPARDYIIEIDNKSLTHRPDLWGHYGFARELAAIFKRKLKPLAVWNIAELNHLPAFPIKIDNEELCPGYACLAIDSLKPVPSPLYMQVHLYSVGLRAINLLVDLTNYIMLEIGQPMHAFDGEVVKAINVTTHKGGDFTTLDGSRRKMLDSDLMIHNQDGPVGIAGVMGGQSSEVGAATKRIVLESANFQPMSIRRTAVRLNLRTDASARFEKDLPKSFMQLAIARFLRLCFDSGQPPVPRSSVSVAGQASDKSAVISMPANFISRYVGQDVAPALIKDTLIALGFGVQFAGQSLRVNVPEHRSRRDIGIPQDIVEEVARFYGYDNITPKLPRFDVTPYKFNQLSQAEHKLRRLYSQGHSFVEAHSYSWYDDRFLIRLSYEPPACLTLANPIAPYKARLRRELIPNLLEFAANNYDQHNEINLYEIGHCYWPHGNSAAREATRVGLVMYKAGGASELQEVFLSLKGVLADSMALLNAQEYSLTPLAEDRASWALKNSAMAITRNGREIGMIGYVTGKAGQSFKPNARLAWLEFELEALAGPAFPELSFAMPSQYPVSWLDISVLWAEGKGFGALERTLNQFGHPLLLRRKFITHYAGKGLGQGMASYSFRYWLGSYERTLNKEDIDGFQQALMEFLASHGIELRAT